VLPAVNAYRGLQMAALGALVALLALSGWGQTTPGGQPPVPEPPAQAEVSPPEQERPPECAGGFTTTTCSFENEKFVRHFSLLGAIALAAVFATLIPFLLALTRIEQMRWWRTVYWQRWLWPALTGLILAAAFFLVLPLLAYRGILSDKVGLLAYFGVVSSEFFPACSPCSAQVSNYPPLFGWLGRLFMPATGFAIENPGALLLALTLSFAVFSALYFAVYLLWRKLRGFRRSCYKEAAT